MTTRRALWTIIGVSALVRLLLAASLGGYTNEAYYYMYAQHLDWGYFDHPPMVGATAAVGLALTRGLAPVFGLRLGFVVMFAGSSWLLARLTTRVFGPKAGVASVLVLNATIFYGLVVGTFAGPDGPLLFFWLLTLDRLMIALDDPQRTTAWVWVGVAWGLALSSKYHAVLLPSGVLLYLIVRPEARRCLRMPGPYVAAAAGLVVFAPVVIWNAAHGWASFLYQGNRAGGFRGFQAEMFVEALVGQVVYLTPWILAGLVVSLVRLLRRGPRQWSAAEGFLVCQAVPVLTLFLGVSTFRRIMVHWPIIGFVALMPLLGRDLADVLAIRPARWRRRLGIAAALPLLLGCAFVVHARTGVFQDSHGRFLSVGSPLADWTVDTIRWDQIARDLRQRGLLDQPGTFLFTESWRFSSELAMATKVPQSVACYHRDSRSYTFWSRANDWLGRDGIYIGLDDSDVDVSTYAPWFSRIDPVATFPIVRAGVPMQTVRVYRCVHQNHPFPFGYHGPGPMPRPAAVPAVAQTPEARDAVSPQKR